MDKTPNKQVKGKKETMVMNYSGLAHCWYKKKRETQGSWIMLLSMYHSRIIYKQLPSFLPNEVSLN